MSKSTYPIPFRSNGDLYNRRQSYDRSEEPILKPNDEFIGDIEIRGCHRGKYSTFYTAYDHEQKRNCIIFTPEMLNMLPYFVGGRCRARFKFVKKSQSYGLVLVGKYDPPFKAGDQILIKGEIKNLASNGAAYAQIGSLSLTGYVLPEDFRHDR